MDSIDSPFRKRPSIDSRVLVILPSLYIRVKVQKNDASAPLLFWLQDLFGFSFDGLVQSAVGACRHTDDNDLAIDDQFSLLEIDIPATTGRTEGVASGVSALWAFTGNRAISRHYFHLFASKRVLYNIISLYGTQMVFDKNVADFAISVLTLYR